MNTQNAKLILSAASEAQFPQSTKKEILLVGKSNVGKSSLINALTNRKNLAFVGNRPGKTRLINFYDVNEEVMLVDVPGYGYAHRSHQEQLDYAKLMDAYFETRHVDFMFILIDVRRGISEEDMMMIDFALYHDIEAAIVLTKTDKLSRSKVINIKRQAQNQSGLEVFLFSNQDALFAKPIVEHIKNHILG